MNLLIDTHVLIWYLNGDRDIPEKSQKLISNTDNNVFISVASLWEIAIKLSSSKLNINNSWQEIQEYLLHRKFDIIDIKFGHLNILQTLPPHHGDPFDRLIIAQAIAENLTIISADRHFPAYAAPVIWS